MFFFFKKNTSYYLIIMLKGHLSAFTIYYFLGADFYIDECFCQGVEI